MTDENSTPKPEDVEPVPEVDPNYVDPEEEVEPDVVVANAKKSYKLTDRLNNITHRHTKVLLFTDGPAVDAYVAFNEELQGLVDAQKLLDLATEDGQHQSKLLVDRFNELEPKLEDLKVEMLSSGLSVELRAYPAIALKVARRDAKTKFKDPETNDVPESRELEAQEYMDHYLLGQSISQVTDAEGDRLEFDHDTIGKELSNKLPPSQWARLEIAWRKLTLTDEISKAVTDEPGF